MKVRLRFGPVTIAALIALLLGPAHADSENSRASGVPRLLYVLDLTAATVRDQACAELRRAGMNWISCDVIAGDLGHMILMVLLDDPGELSRLDALSHLQGARAMAFAYSPELSCDPARVSFARATAYGVNLALVRGGTTRRYVEQQALAARLLAQHATRKASFLAYKLEFGGEPPAYLFLKPHARLSDVDLDPSSAHPALLTPEQNRKRADVLKESLRSNSSMLWLTQPKSSHLSAAFRAENPELWKAERPDASQIRSFPGF